METIEERYQSIAGKFEIDLMTRHFCADGMMIKRMELPAGYMAYKHKHSYDHYSILCEGRAIVRTDDSEHEYVSGDCILIRAGVRHEIEAIEDIVWFCIHRGVDADNVEIGG